MTDEQDEERLRRILRRAAGPATPPPFERLLGATSAGARRPLRRAAAMTLATVLVAVGALFAGRELASYRQQAVSSRIPVATAGATAGPRAALPQPVLQPIARTSPGAQVAWVGVYPQGQPSSFIGVDLAGRIVGRLEGGRYWRSADGAALFGVTDATVTEYSAADGTPRGMFSRSPVEPVADVAFSPDGRWLAILGAGSDVQLVDLRTRSTQTRTVVSAAAAKWIFGSTLLFSPDSKRLYTIVDPSGPLSITAFEITSTGWVETARAVDGQGGKTLPSCGGVAPKVVGGGRTLVLFCHVDGLVAFVDLATLTGTASFSTEQKNPFWLSPIFTPDGQLLYLHQHPAFGDFMQVVDLGTRTLLGPVPTPKKTDAPGPFGWLFGIAAAGGVASTVPVSPDGSKLYAAASDGVTVLRIPDLKPVAKLAQGLNINEVWISGDGKTVFATDNGKGLYVIPESGGPPIPLTLPAQIGGFLASEHG